MNIIQQLHTEASNTEIDEYKTQFVASELNGERLCCTITHYNGGDGQVRKVDTRVTWVLGGKKISRNELEKLV